MTMFKVKSGNAYAVHCYCKKCKKEFEINLFHLLRVGSVCPQCEREDERNR